MPDVASEATGAFGAYFLYVAYDSAQSIGILRIDRETGEITQAAPDVLLGDQPSYVLAHPSLPYLYVTSGTGGFIDGFQIDPDTGMLTELPGMPVSVTGPGESPRQMSLRADGLRLFVANGTGSSATFHYYDLNPSTGVLTETSGSPASVELAPGNFVVTSPQGFIYTAVSPQNVYGFSVIGISLGLLPNTPWAASAVDPLLAAVTAENLYVVNQSSIDTYLINADTGELNPGNTITTTDNNGAIALHPTLPVLYMSPAISEEVQVYGLNGSGLPANTPMAVVPLMVSSRFLFGPVGRLYVVNPFGDGSAPTISSLHINSNGTLSDRADFFIPGGISISDGALKSF